MSAVATARPSSSLEMPGDGTDGLYRQSVLASWDNCPLATKWRLESPDIQGPEAAAGTLMHATFAEALRTMRREREPRISPEDCLAILNEQMVAPGAPHVPARYLRNVRVACIKWALNNSWTIEHLVQVEHRLYADLYLPHTGEVVQLTGQPDALLADPPGGGIVLDYKLTWAVPPKSAISERGYFQQRSYGYLVLKTYPGLERCTLREQYPLVDEVREATLYRGDLEEVEAELLAGIAGLEEAKATGRWEPQPGAHCRYCPRPAHCPASREQRGAGGISNLEVAQNWAAEWVVADAVKERRTKALKAWVSDNGPIVVRSDRGEAVLGWKVSRNLEGYATGRRFGLHKLADDAEIEGMTNG